MRKDVLYIAFDQRNELMFIGWFVIIDAMRLGIITFLRFKFFKFFFNLNKNKFD